MSTGLAVPEPTPTRNVVSQACHSGLLRLKSDIWNMAAEKMTIPTVGYQWYRPFLLICRPTSADERMIPIDVGINAKPDGLRSRRSRPARRGRKMASPKLAEPMKKVVAVHTPPAGRGAT